MSIFDDMENDLLDNEAKQDEANRIAEAIGMLKEQQEVVTKTPQDLKEQQEENAKVQQDLKEQQEATAKAQQDFKTQHEITAKVQQDLKEQQEANAKALQDSEAKQREINTLQNQLDNAVLQIGKNTISFYAYLAQNYNDKKAVSTLNKKCEEFDKQLDKCNEGDKVDITDTPSLCCRYKDFSQNFLGDENQWNDFN